MEDTVTYVDEPEAFDAHLATSRALRGLEPERILPNHGDPEVIAARRVSGGLISATEQYIESLCGAPGEAELRELCLREVMAEPLEAGLDQLLRALRGGPSRERWRRCWADERADQRLRAADRR